MYLNFLFKETLEAGSSSLCFHCNNFNALAENLGQVSRQSRCLSGLGKQGNSFSRLSSIMKGI